MNASERFLLLQIAEARKEELLASLQAVQRTIDGLTK